jgi:hypothetical protein
MQYVFKNLAKLPLVVTWLFYLEERGTGMRKFFNLLFILIISLFLNIPAKAILKDNGNGTITDTESELMWLQDAGALGRSSWPNAFIVVEDFNEFSEKYNPQNYTANYSDWRLPSRGEYGTLLGDDLGGCVEPIGPNHPFVNLTDYPYWCSKPLPPTPYSNIAWYMVLIGSCAYTNYNLQSLPLRVWAVRDHSVEPVSIDIKPNSCPNPLNIDSKGVLTVAVHGASNFDITTIDTASVRLEGVAPIRSTIEDVVTPVIDPQSACECNSDGADGFDDLVLKFRSSDVSGVLGEVQHGDVIELMITGNLIDGTPIEGYDCIVCVKKGIKD